MQHLCIFPLHRRRAVDEQGACIVCTARGRCVSRQRLNGPKNPPICGHEPGQQRCRQVADQSGAAGVWTDRFWLLFLLLMLLPSRTLLAWTEEFATCLTIKCILVFCAFQLPILPPNLNKNQSRRAHTHTWREQSPNWPSARPEESRDYLITAQKEEQPGPWRRSCQRNRFFSKIFWFQREFPPEIRSNHASRSHLHLLA